MRILTLARKESQEILGNRIYLLVVLVQVFIILGAVGLAVASSVATDPALLDRFGATSTLVIGASEDLQGTPLESYLKEQNLKVEFYNDYQDAQQNLGGQLIGFISISPQGNLNVQLDNSNVFFPVISSKVSTAISNYQVEQDLRSIGVSESKIAEIQSPLTLQEIKLNVENETPITLDSSYFVEIMYGFIVPFILLLPFFLASNIVTDSIVGEKERKTFEVLLMTPLSSSMVIIGKIIPILFFSLIQSTAWILLLNLLRVPIFNIGLILFTLFFIGLAFIGLGILISILVDSTKEANSAITLVLVFATFILFVPLFIKSGVFQPIFSFIPTVIMVRMASSPNLNPELFLYLIPTIIISLSIFFFTVRSFKHERAIRL